MTDIGIADIVKAAIWVGLEIWRANKETNADIRTEKQERIRQAVDAALAGDRAALLDALSRRHRL